MMGCDYCWPGNCCGGPNCMNSMTHRGMDIVERLRVFALTGVLRDDAIAEIERLRAENEWLRDEKGCRLLDMKDEIERLQSVITQQHADFAKQQEDMERLRVVCADHPACPCGEAKMQTCKWTPAE
jgi:hypothetical protein